VRNFLFSSTQPPPGNPSVLPQSRFGVAGLAKDIVADDLYNRMVALPLTDPKPLRVSTPIVAQNAKTSAWSLRIWSAGQRGAR